VEGRMVQQRHWHSYFFIAAVVIVLGVTALVREYSQPNRSSLKEEGRTKEQIRERFNNVEAGDFIRFKNENVWFAIQRIEKTEGGVVVHFWTHGAYGVVLRNFANEQLKDIDEIVMRNGWEHAKWAEIAVKYIASHP
jgi:hypothetical protein